MKKINITRWPLVYVVVIGLLTSCLVADRAKTGVVVYNESGSRILVSVKYEAGLEELAIPARNKMLVLSDFADGGSRSPQLREDLVSIEITDGQGRETSYTRAQILNEASWDRKSRQWLLTVR